MWASPFTFSAQDKSLDERILQIMFRQREQNTVTIISELISQPPPFFFFWHSTTNGREKAEPTSLFDSLNQIIKVPLQ